jgi:hypothetical protein
VSHCDTKRSLTAPPCHPPPSPPFQCGRVPSGLLIAWPSILARPRLGTAAVRAHRVLLDLARYTNRSGGYYNSTTSMYGGICSAGLLPVSRPNEWIRLYTHSTQLCVHTRPWSYTAVSALAIQYELLWADVVYFHTNQVSGPMTTRITHCHRPADLPNQTNKTLPLQTSASMYTFLLSRMRASRRRR